MKESVLRVARKPRPKIRISPYAWAKLLYLRDAGATEIGGFGISAPGEPLLVVDVELVTQTADWASVVFDDAAVADYYDRQVEQGRTPSEFGRIWVHTHPGSSPQPSATDEETFARAFGGCQWAVMLIVARGGASYARLAFGVGPGGSWEIPVEIDYDMPFAAADRAAWQAEYDACVQARSPLLDDQELEEFDSARLWPRENAWCEDGYDAVFEQSV
ncbi:Mov34/MPN/PAD-1 family protein [Lacipirellula limnantheis]|uniref:Mov34/MPN/PAD-1 family protein n=1 Tax=Lacipirellula limnantheis TaxID=2528024 RepID=UPI0011A15967|nr:Mov34/MPN/PAD-1 family protein [Lacipirellula limnantheis]